MSRATVRAAIHDFFATPNVTGLSGLFPSQPGVLPDGAYFPGPTGSGAVLFVFIEREREWRRSMGGEAGGVKEVLYDVALVGEYRSGGIDQEASIANFDGLVEALKTRMRSDRQLGSSSIFQAGEGDTLGSPDVELLSDIPIPKGDTVRIWMALRFHVVEMVLSGVLGDAPEAGLYPSTTLYPSPALYPAA